MAKFTTSAFRKTASITHTVAFLPSVISSGFFLLALGMIYFETTPLSTSMEKKLPFNLVRDVETGRMILNTLASGIISLTVFSFSMVMIVLSQASSNLSPRVLPGLTTARSHQIVLGFYIGTIIYIMLLLLSYKPQGNGSQSPAIAILLGLTLGIICLVLFVYFIHSISRAIQVDNILNSVFHEADDALVQEEKVIEKSHAPDSAKSASFDYALQNAESGYLKQVVLSELQQLAKEHNMQIEILTEVGSFTVEGTPLIQLTKDPSAIPGLEAKLQDCFIFSQDEVVLEDYEQGVKQISEIAVKALSPGINDPGTALKAIDFLTLLFIRRIKCNERNCLLDEEKQVLLIDKIISVDELMYRYLSPIRTYGNRDLQIILRLLKCFHNMLYQQLTPEKIYVIRKHAFAVVTDAETTITNEVDRARLNKYISELNTLLPDTLKLNQLKL